MQRPTYGVRGALTTGGERAVNHRSTSGALQVMRLRKLLIVKLLQLIALTVFIQREYGDVVIKSLHQVVVKSSSVRIIVNITVLRSSSTSAMISNRNPWDYRKLLQRSRTWLVVRLCHVILFAAYDATVVFKNYFTHLRKYPVGLLLCDYFIVCLKKIKQ